MYHSAQPLYVSDMRTQLISVQSTISSIIKDFGSVLLLCVFSYFLTSYFHTTDYLTTGYPDFSVHAFRIEYLKQFGLTSWTHIWSNGANIFQSYQIIPHLMTLGLSIAAHIETTRAMVLMIIGMTIVLPIIIYSIERMLGLSTIASFGGGLSVLALSQYWGSISDYSIVFGFFFFPFMVGLSILYA